MEAHIPLLFRGNDSDASDDDIGGSSDAEVVDERTFPDEVVAAVAWASGLGEHDQEEAVS